LVNDGMSLGQAIQQLRPGLNTADAADIAMRQAEEDLSGRAPAAKRSKR
jgi:hypothetical protein